MNPYRNLGTPNLQLMGSESQDSLLGICLLVEKFQEGSKDPFGKAPDHVVAEVVRREETVFTPDCDPSLAVNPRPSQFGQRHPQSERNFVVGLQGWPAVDGKDEGSYDHRP